MTIPGGLRSCTETNFSPVIFINSTLTPPTDSGSHYDITLLTLLVVGSYSFCIVPLLATFTGKRSRLYSFFISILKHVFCFVEVGKYMQCFDLLIFCEIIFL